MTVTGLLHSLAKSLRTAAAHLNLNPKEVAGVDISAITHACLYGHAESILVHGDWDGFDHEVEATLQRMLKWRCKCLWLVGDGRRIKSKLANATRADARTAALEAVSVATDIGGLPAPHDLRTAIGSHAITATVRLCAISRRLGITTKMALFEAEQQLVYLQQIGVIDVILCNDGDYIACGGDSMYICNYRWRGNCRFFHRGNIKNFVAQGRVRKRAVDGKREPGGESAQADFDEAIATEGMKAVLLYCLVAGNDYNRIKGVGVVNAQRAVAAAIKAGHPTRAAVANEIQKATKGSLEECRVGWKTVIFSDFWACASHI
jgi:hypothetical protein